MKSGTFARTLNHNPFEISKYRNNILHSGLVFILRAPVLFLPLLVHTQLHLYSCQGLLSPLRVRLMEYSFKLFLLLPCLLLPWNTVGKVRGQLCLFVTLAIIFLKFCGCASVISLDVSKHLFSLSYLQV